MSEGKFSFSSLRLLASWVDQLMYCKSQLELNPNHNYGTQLIGSFRATNVYRDEKLWTYCGYNVELPEIISHYLRLNLTFIKPYDDFDGTFGWYNGTHSNGPMKMIINNEVDYIFNRIFISEHIWNPKLYHLSTALWDEYTINFITKKQILNTSIQDYFNTFNLSIWMLIFSLVALVSIIQTFISFIGLQTKFNKFFCLKLSWDYIAMFLNKSSNLLSKLTPRHYIMYFIPILSVLIINLFQNTMTSNIIIPEKYWCQDLTCFAQSKIQFYTYKDEPSAGSLQRKNEWQIKEILSRLTIGFSKGKCN